MKDRPISAAAERDRARLFIGVSVCFILALPIARLIEALLRSIYMSEYYDGLWQGLTKDMWFSEGWVSYIQTPLGMTMTAFPILLLAGAIGFFVLAIRTGSTNKKAQ